MDWYEGFIPVYLMLNGSKDYEGCHGDPALHVHCADLRGVRINPFMLNSFQHHGGVYGSGWVGLFEFLRLGGDDEDSHKYLKNFNREREGRGLTRKEVAAFMAKFNLEREGI
mmetsp:Transcript_15363/g.62682  ORF Transcript_15363/g.62682 Transcript_15363/m.62682 type:complete len:112 (+) Transcript_15363:1343-1678(+)